MTIAFQHMPIDRVRRWYWRYRRSQLRNEPRLSAASLKLVQFAWQLIAH
jgi:hypothetical protein